LSTGTGCLRYRFGKLRSKDRLALWLQHVCLCLAEPDPQARESVLVCSDATLRLKPPPDARAVLESVLDLYRQGLERPLHFFPESSLEYVNKRRGAADERRALAAARSRWEGNDFQAGEGEDPYFQRCFEGIDPLDTEFKSLSRRLYDPFRECVREERSA
jgi:exodeoxyribonuclease V gamma subunit